MYAEKYFKGPFSFDKEFFSKLKSHSFPGNVRELQYVLERAVIMADGDTLAAEDLVFTGLEKSVSTSTGIQETNLETLYSMIHQLNHQSGDILWLQIQPFELNSTKMNFP